jgi:hypothetical protein
MEDRSDSRHVSFEIRLVAAFLNVKDLYQTEGVRSSTELSVKKVQQLKIRSRITWCNSNKSATGCEFNDYRTPWKQVTPA